MTEQQQTIDFIQGELIYADEAVRWMVPINSTLNYFECEIISKGETGHGIWIGISPWPGDVFYHENVVSYRVDNGHLHCGNACSDQDCGKHTVELINMTCSEGDTIGCGVDFDGDHHSDYVDIFFTKNGLQISDRIKCKKPCFSVCPVVGMGEIGEKIHFLQHCYRPSLLSVSNTKFYCTTIAQVPF